MELPRRRQDWLKVIAVVVAVIVAYQVVKRALPDIDWERPTRPNPPGLFARRRRYGL